MMSKNIGYVYLIVQSKNISSEMISGIKASILLKEIIELENGSYLFIKSLNNDKHRNNIVINTIQKIYDLLINKSVRVYIVDNKDTGYSNFDKNKNIVSLDELYNNLDFKYVAKLSMKSNVLYFVISYIDQKTEIQNTHIFPTNYVSRELFERNHLLNNYNINSSMLDLEDDMEIIENKNNNNKENSENHTKITTENKSKSNNTQEYSCEKCNLWNQNKEKLIIGFIFIISFYISIVHKF